MRRMKKARQYLLGIFAALLLCGIFSVNTVKADTQYVYDNASLLSDEEEQDLERSCAEFESNTDIHMVILTEYSSGSEDCQAIADDFYDKKYPKEPNGVCFLIDMGQRQIVISTSGIMQYYMSDAEIDDCCPFSCCDRILCLFWNLEELQTKEKPRCKGLCGSETRKNQRPQGCTD